jgi:uncharacterized protein (TIRG00374 family)
MADLAPPPPGRPSGKDRRRALITAGVAVAILIVVFGLILPQVIDYETVWDTITSLSTLDLLVLLAAGLIYYVPEGWLFALVVPGLGLWRGIKAWVASTGVGSTVPALDMVTRFGMYRSWGFSTPVSMRGIFMSGAFDWVVKFSIPVLAVVLLALAGVQDLGVLAVIAGIAGAVLAVVLVVLVGAIRSQRFTRWVAARIDRLASWALEKARREPIPGLQERVVDFRDDAVEVAARAGARAFVASALGKLWQYVMLLLAIRAVDVPADVLSAAEIFVVWAVVLLITMIPITPGGIGIAELFYIGFFAYITGPEWSSIVAAGVMLYRVFQWALPIPIGWTIALRWRRKVQRGELPDPFATPDDPQAGITPSG